MPSPYAAAYSPRLNFVAHGRKPHKARLPGLDIVACGRSLPAAACGAVASRGSIVTNFTAMKYLVLAAWSPASADYQQRLGLVNLFRFEQCQVWDVNRDDADGGRVFCRVSLWGLSAN